MPEKKPNILLLISDEHRPDLLPVEGNEVVRTAVLDRLMGESVYFRSAYIPSPVCVPELHVRPLSAKSRLHRFRQSHAERSLNYTRPTFSPGPVAGT